MGELVTVTVADHGHFKLPPECESLRRRWLLLIERATCAFELVPHARGTRVNMSWPLPDRTVTPLARPAGGWFSSGEGPAQHRPADFCQDLAKNIGIIQGRLDPIAE